jgi:hypothetical protein
MARNSRSSHVSYDRVLQRSVDPRTAFDIGYQQATGGQGDGSDSVRHVKNNYEQRLANYLKQLPEDPDFAGVPQQFRNNLSNYLSNAKSEYVAAANAIDDMVVGSDDYMDTMAKMNGIKSSFENLDGQFKLYNATKKTVIDDIEGQRISMYGENQANANLLRGIFNEEYELEIDETGNLYFVGDDGKIGLNDLPDYGMKDFGTADKMMTMGVNVYQNGAKNGYILKRDDVMYHQYSNKLKRMIYDGGKNTLMSVLYDGLVGDIAMADDPALKELINGYENGAVGFDELTKATVDSYMKTLVQQSQNGTKQRKVTPSKTNTSGDQTNEEYYSADINAFLKDELPNMDTDTDEGVFVAWEQSGVLGKNFKLISDGAGGYVIRNIYGTKKYINVGTYPKTDHAKFLAILKRNGIK